MMMLLVFLVLVTLLFVLSPGGTAAAGVQPVSPSSDALRDVFPVSGFQIAMVVLVVVILIAGGIALRRLSRPRTPAEPEDTPEPRDVIDTTGSDEDVTTPYEH